MVTENEANLLLPLGTKSKKVFSFRGRLYPWTLLGAPSPDPRYRLALRALAMRVNGPPHIFGPGDAPGAKYQPSAFTGKQRLCMGAVASMNDYDTISMLWGNIAYSH